MKEKKEVKKVELKPKSRFIVPAMAALVIVLTIVLVTWFIAVPIVKKQVADPVSPCEKGYTAMLVDKVGISTVLLQNSPSYAANGKFVKSYQVTANVKGIVSCGYLYVRAHVGSGPLNDTYDSIYLTCQDSGGHLMRMKSLLPPNPVPNTTEVLFPLNEIQFVPHVPYNPADKNFRISNWVQLLNTAKHGKVRFWIALSTLNTTGVIDEVKIVYVIVSH